MVSRKVYLYEILIRLGPDGVTGAHCADIEVISDDSGGVIAERLMPPRLVLGADTERALNHALLMALRENSRLKSALAQQTSNGGADAAGPV